MELAKTEIQHVVEALVLAGRGSMPHAKRRRNERLLRRLNKEWLAATVDKPGASAPDLLAALQEALRCFTAMCDTESMPTDTCPADLVDICSAAISKATGE